MQYPRGGCSDTPHGYGASPIHNDVGNNYTAHQRSSHSSFLRVPDTTNYLDEAFTGPVSHPNKRLRITSSQQYSPASTHQYTQQAYRHDAQQAIRNFQTYRPLTSRGQPESNTLPGVKAAFDKVAEEYTLKGCKNPAALYRVAADMDEQAKLSKLRGSCLLPQCM